MAKKKWTSEQRQADQQQKLAWLDERIAERVEQLVTGDDWLNALRFATKFRTRSFLNTLGIYIQHQQAYSEGRVPEPTPTLLAGYGQWKQLGRWVVEGQRGYMIRKPVFERYASANPAGGQWRLLGFREQPRPGDVVREKFTRTVPGYVWDVSQTDGQEIPERPRGELPKGAAPPGLWDGLSDLVAKGGFTLSDVPNADALGGASGVTNYTDRTVFVRVDLDEAARVAILAHELGHLLMHDPEAEGREPHRGIREVEAESFAAMICAAYDLDSLDSTVPYVAGWAWSVKDKEPGEVIRATGDRVVKVACGVIDKLPEPVSGNGKPDIPEAPARKPSPPKRGTRGAARTAVREAEAISL